MFFYNRNFFNSRIEQSMEQKLLREMAPRLIIIRQSHMAKILSEHFIFCSKVVVVFFFFFPENECFLYLLEIVREDMNSRKYSFLCHAIILMFLLFSKFCLFLIKWQEWECISYSSAACGLIYHILRSSSSKFVIVWVNYILKFNI